MKNHYFLLACLLSFAGCPAFAQSSVSPESDATGELVASVSTAEPVGPAGGHYDPLLSFRNALLREVRYPAPALQLGHEGTVLIRVYQRSDGYVAAVRITKSAGRLLDAAVLAAAEKILLRQPPARTEEASARKMDFPVVFRP